MQQSNLASGLESYRFAFAITEHLTQADPGNDYRISLALAERLANADPANSAWQRELALSHGRIGMVLARQGSQRDAVMVLKQGHAILLRLRQQAPGDAAVPTDVAWFEERMAELKK